MNIEVTKGESIEFKATGTSLSKKEAKLIALEKLV